LVADNAVELARLETLDNGKLLRETQAQARGVPEWLYYFGGFADKIAGTVLPTDPATFNYTLREPVGVVAAISAWNSPLSLATTKLAPALAAGNTVILKPSEHASASVVELASLAQEAGFPAGVVNVITGHAAASAALVAHEGVDKVTFTGSTETGKKVAHAAVEHLARLTLELGGKSPQIVFDDADLSAATNGIVAGIFAAAGQTCVAGSRVFVQQRVYDEVRARVVARAETIRIGDPLEETTELGPLAFRQQLDRVERYVQTARSQGATLLAGGSRPPALADGFFYSPTVFADVTAEMTLAREEVFGPVLALMTPFSDDDEAIAGANETRFGLTAGIWTENLRRAHRLARHLEAGTVWINTYRALSPLSPFGGFRASGFGKENGAEAISEFTRVKSVWINTSTESARDPFVIRASS
jgi:aldehyde dehydrogenase (NAD+)